MRTLRRAVPVIWPLALLWGCLVGLSALCLVGAFRFADEDHAALVAHRRHREALGRCSHRALTIDPAGSSNSPHGLTSRGVSTSAARRR